MKQIKGKPVNIEEDIVGRVTFGKNMFQRSNEIWVNKDASIPAFGYVATITTKETITDNGKPYCVVNDITDFHEGDIVVINKQGEIIFVYEIESNHNAIMATERCNHRCIMCPQPPILQEKDKTPFNLKLISLFDKHTQEIGITGGEPTLIGDNLFVLINHIKKELPKTAISILSNGVKFAVSKSEHPLTYGIILQSHEAECEHPSAISIHPADQSWRGGNPVVFITAQYSHLPPAPPASPVALVRHGAYHRRNNPLDGMHLCPCAHGRVHATGNKKNYPRETGQADH